MRHCIMQESPGMLCIETLEAKEWEGFYESLEFFSEKPFRLLFTGAVRNVNAHERTHTLA